MEITVLLEKEGLSVWVREGNMRLLFDTGPDDSLLGNAKAMGIDLSTITALVLSHNHSDHTGGVMPLLKHLDGPVPVYMGKNFFRDKYIQDGDTHEKLRNLEMQTLIDRGMTLHEVGAEPLPLGGRLYLLSGWGMPYPFEPANERYVLREESGWKADPFTEETALVYDGNEELTLLCGCSHPGIAGMVAKAAKAFNKPVHTLLGGTHLRSADDERLQKTAEIFVDQGVKVLGLSHCSGDKIGKLWKKKYGAVVGFHVGDRVVGEIV